MSDQFNRQKITREIARIKSEAERAIKEVSEMRRIFNEAHARVVRERDSFKQRAEKAEAQLIEAKGRAEDGRRRAMTKINRLREALKFYANTDNWDETEDPVITSRDPLGSTPFFHIVFLGQDERWPGHPSSAAIEALEPPKENHEQ
jgi:hypothetical protein